MKKLIPLIFVGFVFFFAACENNPDDLPEKINPPALTSTDVGSFDMNLFRAECSLNDGNVIISPFSVSNVTKMFMVAAYGETEEELLEAYNSNNTLDLLKANKHVMQQLSLLDSNTVQCVNAFYYDKKDITPNSEFKNALAQYFAAEGTALDFSAKQMALDAINDWSNTNTNGKIPVILNDIQQGEVLFLLNAVYLKAYWSSPFDPARTSDGKFITGRGDSVTVSYMSRRSYFNHATYEDGEMIELPYRGNELSLFLIKPLKGTLDAYIDRFSRSTFDHLLENRSSQDIQLYFPKFTLEYKNENMQPSFELMGIQKMFTPLAELKIGTSQNNAVSRIVHKTYFMVNEKGTEGAAVTVGGAVNTSAPPVFNLNRPFMFILSHNVTGQILFVGKIENPAG